MLSLWDWPWTWKIIIIKPYNTIPAIDYCTVCAKCDSESVILDLLWRCVAVKQIYIFVTVYFVIKHLMFLSLTGSNLAFQSVIDFSSSDKADIFAIVMWYYRWAGPMWIPGL